MKITEQNKGFVHRTHQRSLTPWEVDHHCKPENLNRHIILEIVYDFLCKPASIFLRGYIRSRPSTPEFKIEEAPKIKIRIFKLMKVPFNILNGINCEFPPRDIALYIVELMRKDYL